MERVAPVGLGEYLWIHSDIDDDGPLRREGLLQRWAELRRILNPHTERAHVGRDGREVWVVEVGPKEALVEKVVLVSFLRPVLPVIEQDGNNIDLLGHRGHHLLKGHAPGPVTNKSEDGKVGPRKLRAERRRVADADAAKAAGAEPTSGLVEMEVGIGRPGNIADVCDDEGVLWCRLLYLPECPPRVYGRLVDYRHFFELP